MEVKGQQPGWGPDLQRAAAAVGLQLTLNINQTSFRSYGNRHRASHLAASRWPLFYLYVHTND